ncbi:D-alanyl-D-alanine carboxypeptidase family protein [Bacillus sp. Marseille-Q1617]|uniref:D-alanyl-D-alanine carboxypeptidase family protein n=1 Tax=Bacillus sp. Marseille-Q1617 TaxID=2736887 RepID=UPI00158B6555|nr:D-alanyl-D-alanine carboxypeptidase family protein [Bacillus sp. Marseille-Q1617]
MKKTITLMIIMLFWVSSPMASAQENKANKPDTLFSKSAVLIDSGTGSVLYSKNAHKKMNPASITKVATAIYALEHTSLDETVTVSDRASKTEGSTVYLLAGETISMHQLLQGLMVNSGNDAAVAIAEHTEGSVEAFMKKLNEFLRDEVGVKNTHFDNPHGLYDENHYTTAYDMAEITSYALKNDAFKQLFDIGMMNWSSEGWKTTLYNHHKMVKGELPYPEVTGGKNGFVPEANHTLVTSAENAGLSVVAVTMNAQSKRAIYADTKSLLDYGLKQFMRTYVSKDSEFQTSSESYQLPSDFHYTKHLNETVNEVVDQDGILTIYNGQNEKIASTKLKAAHISAKKQQDVLASSIHGMKKSDVSDSAVFYPLFLYLIILVMAGISMMKRREREL